MAEKHIHIGNIIREELEKQERTVSWLARKIGCTHRTTLKRMLEKNSIDSEILNKISAELKTDFHALYSQNLLEKTKALP